MTDLDFRTSRLEVRPLVAADTEPLHALWTAPGVRRYLWDDEVIPLDRTSSVVPESIRLFETAGYGLWAARFTLRRLSSASAVTGSSTSRRYWSCSLG